MPFAGSHKITRNTDAIMHKNSCNWIYKMKV
jgi:hypothetical protein